jgi:hypothetical protein
MLYPIGKIAEDQQLPCASFPIQNGPALNEFDKMFASPAKGYRIGDGAELRL